jgi:hypothetical protein
MGNYLEVENFQGPRTPIETSKTAQTHLDWEGLLDRPPTRGRISVQTAQLAVECIRHDPCQSGLHGISEGAARDILRVWA